MKTAKQKKFEKKVKNKEIFKSNEKELINDFNNLVELLTESGIIDIEDMSNKKDKKNSKK